MRGEGSERFLNQSDVILMFEPLIIVTTATIHDNTM
jgi:hypothetical protein